MNQVNVISIRVGKILQAVAAHLDGIIQKGNAHPLQFPPRRLEILHLDRKVADAG